MMDLSGMLPERARPFYEHFYNAAISENPIADAAQRALSASSSSEEKRAGARDAEQHHMMEGLRAALLRLVLEANAAGQEVMQYRGQQQRSGRPYLERLLAIVLDLCQLSMMEPGTITSLLEELVDLSTVQEMQGVFDFLDRHLGVIKARIIDPDAHRPNNPRMLTMLRTCNKLLRRLSKSNDSQLAGRVLILLAKLCRISDKSGVNMQGFVNEEHSTLVEEVEPGTVDSNGAPVDVGFYRTFWQLQAVFQNPQQLLTSTAAWSKALEDIRKTLQRFRALPVAVSTSAAAAAGAARTAAAASQAASAEAGADAMEVEGAAAASADVTVKYLSSSKLMGLQIQDALFRRHFLVQVLITLHYCQLPPNARLLREGPVALKPQQLQEVQALIAEVEEVLRATPDAGDAFQEAVLQILQRERLWLLWKNSGCRDIERKPAGELLSHPGACKREHELAESKRLIGAPLTADLGDAELSRIWHNGRHSSLQNLTLPNRSELPRLRRYVDRILEDMATDVRVASREAKKAAGGSDKDEADDRMAMFDDDHLQVCGQELFQFRALRQLSRHNCIALVEVMEGIDQLEAAAAPMKEQIGSAGLALKCAVWDQFQEPNGWKRPPKKGDKKTKHSSSTAAASADPEKPAQVPGSGADKGAGGGRRKAGGEDAEGASSKRRKTAE